MNFLKIVLKKSLLSLLNRKFFITLAISIFLSALVVAAIAYAVKYSFAHFVLVLIPPSYTLLYKMSEWVVSGGALVVSYLLFMTFIPLIASLFEDQVASDVETANYPSAPATHPTPIKKALLHGITFSSSLLLINILLLPFHLIPFLSFFSFVPLNSYLLARERFEAIALRYVTPEESKIIFKTNRMKFFLVGLVLVILSQVPFIKFLVPFISITIMVHSFHEIKNTAIRKN